VVRDKELKLGHGETSHTHTKGALRICLLLSDKARGE
jgi:hypothetical protein